MLKRSGKAIGIEVDFHTVCSGPPVEGDTRGIDQARLLTQCICGSPTAFRDVKELRICRINRSLAFLLRKQVQVPQHMALASMAIAFQNLQVHIFCASTCQSSWCTSCPVLTAVSFGLERAGKPPPCYRH